MAKSFYSCGKLLLTGEYAVLHGAKALALPTKLGQKMLIEEKEGPNVLHWEARDDKNETWFEAIFNTENLQLIQSSDDTIAERLKSMLSTCKSESAFLDEGYFEVFTQTEFPLDYGLGTSSTLINNLSYWARIDPFKILKKAFSGSGFDLAVAQCNAPLTYWLLKGEPNWVRQQVNFPFQDQLFFVHLNIKQISREVIKKENQFSEESIHRINEITKSLSDSESLGMFEELLNEHEQIISKGINQKTIKEMLFKNFNGCIKSLGAWGGDFILVTGEKEYVETYFKNLGYNSIFNYSDLILNE